MPRSPSPPPPRYRQERRYRDDSPPRNYRGGPRWDDRRNDDYRPTYPRHREDDYRRRDWDDRRPGPGPREYDRSRDRDPSPGFRRPPSDKAGSSRGSPVKATLQTTPSGRSGTPEEGQITSPAPASTSKLPMRPRSPPPLRRRSPSPLPLRRRSPSPPPLRRRSPSPPPRRYADKPFVRDRRGWESRERDVYRGPDRYRGDRPFNRFDRNDRDDRNDHRRSGFDDRRDVQYRRSRTPPARSHRSPSPSSLSSRSHSSRFTSPRKRSPEKRSPPPQRRLDSPPRRRSPTPPPRRHTPPLPAQALSTTAQPAPPLPAATSTPAPAKPAPFGFSKPPPSGPRGDRAPPTGPRALSGGFQPRFSPYVAPPPKLEPPKFDQRPEQRQDRSSPTKPTPTEDVSVKEEKPVLANPYRAVPAGPSAVAGTSASGAGSGPAGRLSWAERNMGPGQAPIAPQSAEAGPSGYSGEVQVKPEPKEEAAMIPEPTPMEDLKPAIPDAEARLLEEIAALPNRSGLAQWELDLDAHYKHSQTLSIQINRAQSASRIAAAILNDAEAERAAAADRTKTVMDLLRAGDAWNAGILGVGGI